MYIGRIVAIGANAENCPVAAYRVSSRSFGNRIAVENCANVMIVPSPGHETYNIENPYISYTCLSALEHHAVISNGSHTTIIANKLSDGFSMRDALSQCLVSMDYEHDELDTPRIAGIVEPKSMTGYLGVVSKYNIQIRQFELVPNKIWFLSTYGLNEPLADQAFGGYAVASAEDACEHILHGEEFRKFENPISAASALWGENGWTIASRNVAQS